jgi:hypothetical protein
MQVSSNRNHLQERISKSLEILNSLVRSIAT